MATRYTMVGTAAGVTAAVVAALVAMSGSERAQSLGLTRHGQTLTVQDAGAPDAVAVVAVAPGVPGQVYTISDAGLPHWAAAATGGGGPSVYYAQSFTAVAGSESASISGTGDTSEIVLSASSTSRSYGTAGTTAAHAILALPAGTRTVEVDRQVSAVTGSATGGYRFLTIAVQPVSSGTPTALWGISVGDTGTIYAGNLLGGANSGAPSGTASTLADRWVRVTLALAEPRLAVLAGTGSAGARPTTWAPVTASPTLPGSSSYSTIPDTSGSLYLVIAYQSYGTGGATSVTVRVTVRAST